MKHRNAAASALLKVCHRLRCRQGNISGWKRSAILATAIVFAGEGAKVTIAEIDTNAGEETGFMTFSMRSCRQSCPSPSFTRSW